jgi:hypothetical protein
MPLFINITGQRFGKLVAERIVFKSKYGHYNWLCKCDCGNTRVANVAYLRNGDITSCGKCNYITYNNKSQPIHRWANELGMTFATIKDRLDSGMPLNKVLSPTENYVDKRKEAAEERRKVMLAIENISSTPTARKTGKGAGIEEIQEYTKILLPGVKAALKWLKKRELICASRGSNWKVKNTIPPNFCFSHGVTETIGNICIKCFNERKIK